MDKKNLDALLFLLKDPDNDTFEAVANSLALDANIIPELENLWKQADDEMAASRLDWLIHRARFNKLAKELAAWMDRDASEVIEGAWLVATYQYPELTFAEVDGTIAGIAKDVWLELRDDMTPVEKVTVLNRTLFEKYGFQGDTENVLTLNNVLANNILRSKKGNHLGLAIIYMGVAQKLNIPIFGVPLPRAFVLAYLNNAPIGQNVTFYIDPFTGGSIFDETDAKHFLEESEIAFDPEFVQPCSDIFTISMLIGELMVLYEQKGMNQKAQDMEALLQELRLNN